MSSLTLHKHQTDALRTRRESSEEDNEFTYHMPTGSGKTLLIVNEANDCEGHCLIVFPRLALLSQFYRRYETWLRHSRRLLICTDQKDIKDTCTEDRAVNHYEGAAARAQLRRLNTNHDEAVLILTTYASLPIVINECNIVFRVTLLDEAHHRSESAVSTLLDEDRERFGLIINLSATPTDDCGGEWHVYPFRQAIEDGILRDFTVHFIYIDQSTQYDDMAAAVHRIADLTSNRQCMAFTAFADAEKNNRSNVKKVVEKLQKVGFDAHGITAVTKPDDRRRILDNLSQAATSKPSVVVSCRTLGEGIDVHGVNCVVFWDPRSSQREIIQIIGRALRPYRDTYGAIVHNQPVSSIIIPLPINISEYMALPDDDARDQYLRDQASAENGCYESILNVASALKEADPEMAEFCLMYPSGPKTTEAIQRTRETRKEQGFRVIDIEPDGNCFFRSLEPIVGKPHQTIRREVVDRLLGYPHEERVAWGMEDDDHVRDLYKDGEWANEVMDVIPKIAAEMYGLNMSIYTDGDKPLECFEEGDRRIDLQLLNGHYNRLEPIDPASPPPSKKPSKPYRRRFRGHIDANCRVMWNLCHESLDKGLAVAQHKIITDGMTWEERAIEKAKQWIAFYKINGKWPSSESVKDENEKKMGRGILRYKNAYRGTSKSGATTYDSVNRMLLDVDPTFFYTLEENAIKKAIQWIQFYRANEKWPSSHAKNDKEKKMAGSIAQYKNAYRGTSNSSATYESVNQMLLDIDPTFFDRPEERIIEKARQWITFYRLNRRWPSESAKIEEEKKMGQAIASYKQAYRGKSRGATYESVNTMLLDIDPNFFDTQEERIIEKAKQWIEFYRANGRWPSDHAKDETEKKMGRAILNYKNAYRGTSKSGATTYDSVNRMLLDVDPTFFYTLEENAIDKAKQWIALYRMNGKWPSKCAKNDEEKKMGNQISSYKQAHRGTSKSSATYESVNTMLLEIDPNFFDTLEQDAIEKARTWIAFYESHDNKWPSIYAKNDEEKKMGNQISSYKHAYRGTNKGATYDSVNTMLLDIDPNFFDRQDFEQEAIEKARTWIAFYESHDNKWPSAGAKDDEEKKMGRAIANYKGAYRGANKCATYDSVNTMLLDIDPNFFDRQDFEQEAIEKAKQWIAFYQSHNNKWPSQIAKDETEKKMGCGISRYKMAYRGTHKGSTYECVNTMLLEIDPNFFEYKLSQQETPTAPRTPTTPSTSQKKRAKKQKPADDSKIADRLTKMTSAEKDAYIMKKMLEDAKAKRGEYLAPNKEMKDRINRLLRDRLPATGAIIVLDAEDFGTATVLGAENAHRMIIPQRDRETYQKMREDSVFGSCVCHCDLAEVDLETRGQIGLIYADLMGSIRELKPLLRKFAEAQYVDGAVIAATISCRDGSKESAFTNQFAEKLTYAMAEALFGMGFRRAMDTMVYGESVRMATAIFSK